MKDRFNELYPSLLSVFILRDLFEDDQLYLFFFREHVIPTIIKLCQRINNDLCWKPLNHQLLLLTRNENPCIKIAAVCALQCLFEEVILFCDLLVYFCYLVYCLLGWSGLFTVAP